jgi:hypothetical protein
MKDSLIRAITERKILTFRYYDLRRKVIPATLGYSKTNKLTLHAYQVEGQHRTPGNAWGMVTVSGITDLIFTTETFAEAPPLYRRGDKNMIRIVAEL